MKTTAAQRRVRCEYHGTLEIRAVDETSLPAGTCGRISAIGVRYNVPDAYGTIFKPGCLAKTVAQKVSAGRVRYHADHIYKTTEHIGTVRNVEDVGDDVLITAEIFDTESGRRYLEYAKACMTTKSQTGCSIGFYSRATEMVEIEAERFLAFTEVELEEFSATPVNAVDGADLLSARREPNPERLRLQRAALDALLQVLPESESRAAFAARFVSGTDDPKDPRSPAPAAGPPTGNAKDGADSAHARNAAPEDSPAPAPIAASMDDRLAVVRRSFGTPKLQ